MSDVTLSDTHGIIAAAADLYDIAGKSFATDQEIHDIIHQHLESMGDNETAHQKAQELQEMIESDTAFHAKLVELSTTLDGHAATMDIIDKQGV